MTEFAATVEALLHGAVAAISVDPPRSFAWFGRRETPCSRRLRLFLTRPQIDAAFRTALADCLYREFYCVGRAQPVSAALDEEIEDATWIERLRRSNRSTQCRDGGWTEIGRGGRGSVIVRKEGVILCVDRATTRRTRNRLDLALPNEYLNLSPGFYTVGSHAPFPSRAAMFRIYWNVLPDGAEALIRYASEMFNRAEIPFRLKVAAHPAAFVRCDAGVLYLPRRDSRRAFACLEPLARILSPVLRPETPVFTKAIAPGIAVAEEPSTAESFGQNRCGILARALTRRADQHRTADARLAAVRSHFEARGLPFHRTFLNPGSTDIYPVLSLR